MAEHRLLYLTQQQMSAFRWRRGALLAEGDFAGEAAAESFARYLLDHADSLFSLVVNVGEEGFQNDLIPFLPARDRRTVIARRLGQTFLGAPLAIALSHGYETGARKNERLLLTALTGSATLDPWLAALRNSGSRLRGIYSLPLLSEGLLHQLGLRLPRGILITLQDNTIRQSFIRDNRLLFSRLAPLAGSSVAALAQSIAGEANRFQQYLLSQRMVSRGERLDAHALAAPAVLEAVRAAKVNDGITLHAHDLTAAAGRIGLKTAPGDGRAQALFLHCALSAPPTQQFASAALRRPYRAWRLGRLIRVGGGLAFAAGLLLALKFQVDTRHWQTEIDQRQAEATAKEQAYAQALGRLPPIPVGNDVLRQIYDRIEGLKIDRDTPTLALKHLAQTLDANPPVELLGLTWTAAGAGRGGADPGAESPHETLLVKGNLRLPPAGSPRLLVSTFDQFTHQLRDAAPPATVTVVQTPVDLGAGRALKSADSAASGRAPRDFLIRIDYPAATAP